VLYFFDSNKLQVGGGFDMHRREMEELKALARLWRFLD